MKNDYSKHALSLANILFFLSCFMVYFVIILFVYNKFTASNSAYSLRGIEVKVYPAKWDFAKMKSTPLPSVYVVGRKGDLEMKQTTFQVSLLVFLYDLVFFTAIAIAFFLFRKLFQNLLNNELFSSKNIKLLTKICWILIMTPIIEVLTLTMLDLVTVNFLPPGDQRFELVYFSSFRCSVFVFGVFLLGLLKVFEKGILLKQENDLTV
jgi:hypothetical protein